MQHQNIGERARTHVAGGAVELRKRLFGASERWGWEFVAPAPLAVSHEADRPPVWQEIHAPYDYQVREFRSKKAWKGLVGYLVVTLWATTMAGFALRSLPDSYSWISSIVLFGGVGLSIWYFVRRRRGFTVMKRTFQTQYRSAVQGYEQASADWQRRIAEHDRAELDRVNSALLWHPLRLGSNPSRVDVFGGTNDGWASLLATAGAASLSTGSSMLVLDFCEHAVADNLVVLAAEEDYPVQVHELPLDLPLLSLLEGVDAPELAEVLAESVHSLQRPAAGGDLRGLHADLLTAVAERLESPMTFTRLRAGLRVLRRVYDMSSETALTAGEIRALNTYVDTVGTTEQVANELLTLTGALDLLAREETPADGAKPKEFGSVWPVRGLSVVATFSSHQRRKHFLDFVVFHRALHELRTRRAVGREVLVIAGADRIGLEALEAMARQARRAGVRLVLMLEHLRDDLQKLLGGSDSVSVVMKMGNGAEAATAAEFIGRGYKFVLSQLTDQTGRTFTTGDSSSVGESTGTSTTRGYSHGSSSGFTSGPDGQGSSSFSSSSTRSKSTTQSRSQTWTETVNRSVANSASAGTTQARVYEFTVEPTTLQSLAPTAFVLVETGMTGRRVIMGDCNPGIVLLDRVAAEPRPS